MATHPVVFEVFPKGWTNSCHTKSHAASMTKTTYKFTGWSMSECKWTTQRQSLLLLVYDDLHVYLNTKLSNLSIVRQGVYYEIKLQVCPICRLLHAWPILLRDYAIQKLWGHVFTLLLFFYTGPNNVNIKTVCCVILVCMPWWDIWYYVLHICCTF